MSTKAKRLRLRAIEFQKTLSEKSAGRSKGEIFELLGKAGASGEEGRLTRVILLKDTNSMAQKLYVGNLSYGTTDDSLREAFAEAGSVASATVITDRATGRSKGFGFVEMSSDADAEKAIAMWNGKDLDGRTLVVNEARPFEPRPRQGGNGGGYAGGGNKRDW